MPGRTIVPDRNRTRLPVEAALEFLPSGHLIEVLQQRLAFLAGPAFEMQREGAVDVEQLAAGHRMADHHRMNRAGGKVLPAHFIGHVGLRIVTARLVDMVGRMNRAQRGE